MTVSQAIAASLPYTVPLLVAVVLGTWAAWHLYRSWRLAMHREWLARRPSYRSVLAETRADRDSRGAPASFEVAA